jgi:hypothetical protein
MAEKRTGTFLGVPYDWRRPTKARFRRQWWNPEDTHVIVPRAFGWGYDINLAALTRRLRRPR